MSIPLITSQPLWISNISNLTAITILAGIADVIRRIEKHHKERIQQAEFHHQQIKKRLEKLNVV